MILFEILEVVWQLGHVPWFGVACLEEMLGCLELGTTMMILVSLWMSDWSNAWVKILVFILQQPSNALVLNHFGTVLIVGTLKSWMLSSQGKWELISRFYSLEVDVIQKCFWSIQSSDILFIP
ncbi:hypothetical protein J5N97_030194 [Dioscorea zingiberensis]|uniref:Uncharacterized protein n=1 Tax=Dioscorea zingiberensis TaxID=325984 RepID=A0A9D5BXI2_9LILI|nr:hypothetical protein J5N97_030194 [Dioscorea zingiberensis]